MRMKKTLALLLTLVMAVGMTFVMTGCGEETATDSQDEQQGAVSEEQASPEAETTEPTEETTQAAEAADAGADLGGEYTDEWSQRASATVVEDPESGNVSITVNWSGSATESAVWTMNAHKEGNKLVYSDCTKKTIFYSEDMDEEGDGDEDGMGGGAQETVEYEGGSGSFEIADGKLLWNGADEPDCASCVFVKAQ